MSGKRIRIGGTVRTPKGTGQVLESVSWVDRVSMMSDAEAEAFTRRLRSDIGINFRGEWRHVLVAMKGRTEWFEAPNDVEVLGE